MEKLKKYFEFSGTISGLNYLLRILLTSVIAYLGGFTVGYGVGTDNMGLMTLGLVLLAPTFWFNFTTIYKRCNALFGEQATVYTISIIALQVLNQFFEKETIGNVGNLGLLIIGCVLIFTNSKIESHNG
jgi:uncharacterized membrane protein YhaH (DUF805 family)